MCSCLENRVVIQRKSARRLPNEPRRTASSSNRCPENRVPDRQACVELRGIAFDLGGVSRGIAGYRGVSRTFWRGVGCGAGVSPWQKPYISIWFRRTVCARGRARHYQVRVSRWNRLIFYNIKSAAARPSAEPDAIVEFYARVPCRILRRRRARRAALTDEKARGAKAPRTRANATNTIKIR